MIYMVSTIAASGFTAIRNKFQDYHSNFGSIKELNKSIVEHNLPSEIDTIVIVSPILDKFINSPEIKTLSSNLKSMRPNIRIVAVYTKSEFLKDHKETIESLFDNVKYYQFHGKPQLSQFGELISVEENEVEEEQVESSLKKKIGILGLDTGSGNFIVSSTIAFLVSKRIRGKVGLIETGLSDPRICGFLEQDPETTVLENYINTKKFDSSKMDYVTRNFGMAAIRPTVEAKKESAAHILGYIKSVENLEYAFIDIGTNPMYLTQEALTKELDEIWIVIAPSAKLTRTKLKKLIPESIKDKVHLILNKMDEYTVYKINQEKVFEGYESHVLCEIPIIESNWISKSFWEKTLLPQIPEYLPLISKLFDAPVKHVIH